MARAIPAIRIDHTQLRLCTVSVQPRTMCPVFRSSPYDLDRHEPSVPTAGTRRPRRLLGRPHRAPYTGHPGRRDVARGLSSAGHGYGTLPLGPWSLGVREVGSGQVTVRYRLGRWCHDKLPSRLKGQEHRQSFSDRWWRSQH